MSIYETIRAQMGAAVPFAKHVGIELLEIAPGKGVAILGETATSVNHIGSQHAGALFTLGETASGAAMAGTFADLMLNIRPVASDASLEYRKLARGKITAIAITSDDPAMSVRWQVRLS
jgi:acyl-coenzyme A thioesterase PaaI-like protein